MLQLRKYAVLLMAAFSCQSLTAQPVNKESVDANISTPNTTLLTVGEILITGNKKTKANIILREIPIKKGEKYPLEEIVKKFELARRQLMNTTLFLSVIVAAKDIVENTIDITVEVKERWYLFPAPYLKPVDRNLNQWLVENKGDLNRVNYGAKLLYNNATGRNDQLRMWLINGYTKQVSFGYDRAYFDKKMKWGFKSSFAIGKNREINYNTIDNKQVFLKDENVFLKSFVNSNLELIYRKAIKTRHHFGVAYGSELIKDTVLALNPAYFKNIRNKIQYAAIYYTLEYTDLDYIPYPTKGYASEISISKSGFNNSNNVWQLLVKGFGSWSMPNKFFFSLNAFGGIKLPFNQPYFNKRFLGYGDTYMQGYEYYVIDGVAGGYLKTNLARKIANVNLRFPQKNGKPPVYIPFNFFGKIYGNAGYVYNPQPGENFLNNKMLYSGGLGIDIVTIYDIIFKIEYTFNQLGQNGVFLHRKSIF